MEFSKKDTSFIKGVAICFMLYHHLFAFPERVEAGEFVSLITLNGSPLSVLLGAFGCICMPMFTFLAGYGLYRSSLRAEKNATLVSRHIFSLYKIYWMVFFAALPVIVVRGVRLGSFKALDLVYNFLGLSFSFNAEWWFVLPFAVLLVLFPAMKRFVERERGEFFADVLVIVLINAAFLYVVPALMERPLLAPFADTVFYSRVKELMELLPAYFLGVACARRDLLTRVKTELGAKPLWCVAALVGMLAVFIVRPHNNKTYGFFNAAAFIVCLAVLLPTKPLRLVAPVFEELGRESALMWLTHSFYCYYWLQPLTYAPKYAPLIFLWLTLLSYATAKLLRALYKALGKLTRIKKS